VPAQRIQPVAHVQTDRGWYQHKIHQT
jgi:hypothetical protein